MDFATQNGAIFANQHKWHCAKPYGRLENPDKTRIPMLSKVDRFWKSHPARSNARGMNHRISNGIP